MAIVSVRFNKEEAKILDFLVDTFEEDISSLIKHSLKEMYEDLIDKKIIENFEISESKNKKPKFISSIELKNKLKNK